MRKIFTVILSLVATVALAKSPVADSKVQITGTDHKGVPTFVQGELGQLGPGAADKAAKAFLKSQAQLLHMTGNEDFDTKSIATDSLGQTHVKFQQTLKGLPVFGAEYIVHSDKSGKVLAINGHFAVDENLQRNRSEEH